MRDFVKDVAKELTFLLQEDLEILNKRKFEKAVLSGAEYMIEEEIKKLLSNLKEHPLLDTFKKDLIFGKIARPVVYGQVAVMEEE